MLHTVFDTSEKKLAHDIALANPITYDQAYIVVTKALLSGMSETWISGLGPNELLELVRMLGPYMDEQY